MPETPRQPARAGDCRIVAAELVGTTRELVRITRGLIEKALALCAASRQLCRKSREAREKCQRRRAGPGDAAPGRIRGSGPWPPA